jgi:hypothetical protein
MGISMAICETECRNALCGPYKRNVLKIMVKDPERYGNAAEFDIAMPIRDALKAFDDPDGFMKRNRIGDDICTLHIEKVKNASDRAVLEKMMKRAYTGWIDVSKMDGAVGATVDDLSADDRQTGWDMLSFAEMNDICAKCKLSWDKGRGCLGSFGPDDSALPNIASKYGCRVTGSVPDGVSSKRIYTKDDAAILSAEIPVLRDALAKEGKLAVHRYAGAVDRLEAVAAISVAEGCGFRFF